MLNSKEAVIGFASSMTWNGKHPVVWTITQSYATKIKVSSKLIPIYYKALDRDYKIGKWFLKITPEKAKKVLEIIAQT